jgi:hypothetical protein
VSALAEHQFEILMGPDDTDGVVFGIGADVSVESFDPGEKNWMSQDQDNSRRGTKAFGRDVQGAKTWTWQSHTDQADVASALAILEEFETAWTNEEIVREPGAVTAIRYRVGDRYRRVFGRPRRYAAPPSNLILTGYVPISHDFQLSDSYSYADTESAVVIPYSSSATGGGFSFPTKFPIQTQASDGNGAGQLAVGGTSRAYPVIRFNGPWTNPSIVTDNWSLSWKGSISAAGWVEIDCRPFGLNALSVLNQDGASVVEGLGRQTWLEDCWFAPGSKPFITLAGSAAGGAASATVRWRDTFNSF